MSKEVVFDKEARERMFAGAEKVAKAVMSTLGPCGRLVAVEKDFGGPVLTKDGVTVAKEIDLEDKLEKIGGDIIRETSIKAMIELVTVQQLQQLLHMQCLKREKNLLMLECLQSTSNAVLNLV